VGTLAVAVDVREEFDPAWLEGYLKHDSVSVARLLGYFDGFIRMLARRFFVSGMVFDDFVQEGYIGLDRAVRTFDSSLGTDFCAFAYLCIRRHFYTVLARENRRKHQPFTQALYLDAPLPATDRGTSYLDLCEAPDADPLKHLLAFERYMGLLRYLRRYLTPLEFGVMLYKAHSFSNEEVALSLNISYKQVDNTYRRAKKKCQKFMAQYKSQFFYD